MNEEMVVNSNVEYSAQLNELASALAKAQGMMGNAKKSSANPFFKSKYADLAECWDTIREPLSVNGLAIIQLPGKVTMHEKDKVLSVTTMLVHSSGQYIKNIFEIYLAKADAQGLGSAITYARRYALTAIVGLAQEDDDGNAACGNNVQEEHHDVKVLDNGNVRFIDGTICEVKAGNGKYYRVEQFKLEQLQKMLDNPNFPSAQDAVKVAIEAKSVPKNE